MPEWISSQDAFSFEICFVADLKQIFIWPQPQPPCVAWTGGILDFSVLSESLLDRKWGKFCLEDATVALLCSLGHLSASCN